MARHSRNAGRSLYLGGALLVLLAPGRARAEVVQNCQPTAYVDARAGNQAARELAWDMPIVDDPMRCLLIQTGQSVVWNGSLSVHPLTTQGGDTPNPIGYHDDGESTTVTFSSPGTFGYKCLAHSPMIGAVMVVAAPVTPPSPAPAIPPWLATGLGLVLAVAGFMAHRRARGHGTHA